MRNAILLGLFLFSHSLFSQDFFHLGGTIQNPGQNYITFTYYADWVTEPKEYTLKLDANNSFIVEFPLKNIAYCDLSFGEHGIDLLKIEAGDRIQLSFDNDDFYGTLAASGEGSSKWNFQIDFKKRFEIDRDTDVELANFKGLTQAQFFSKASAVREEQMNLLAQQNQSFSEDFIELQSADILGKSKLKEFGYLNANKLPVKNLDLNWNAFREEIKGKSIYMGQLAESLIDASLTDSRYKNMRSLEYEFIKSFHTQIGQGITDRILAAKILEYLSSSGSNEELKLLADDYLYFADNDAYKKILAANFRKWDKLKLGNAAPNFIVSNSKGRLTELRDFRGKNLVLGFYDNECFFCTEDIKAMEFVKGFYDRRGRKDLEFVFVNLSSKEAYRKFLREEKPMGIHLNGFNDVFLSNNYNLLSLPNYLVLDKSGNILANTIDEPRLDEGRSLIELIDRLIYTK